MTPDFQLLLMIPLGIVITYVTEFLKKQFWLEGNASMAIIVIICSILYAAYTLYLPDVAKEQVWLFVMTAAGASHMFYQLVVKAVKKKR